MTTWDDDTIQFPRLLAELHGLVTADQMAALAASMDLAEDDIESLFERAEAEWERAKASCAPVDPVAGLRPVQPAPNDLAEYGDDPAAELLKAAGLKPGEHFADRFRLASVKRFPEGGR